ncbi:MAG: hypothetical protein MHM6MM_003316 [Cercozoa sp. M6MM]
MKLFLTQEESDAVWREIDELREYHTSTLAPALDASELPAYHYWPASVNTTKRPKFLTPLQAQYHRDMTLQPRFFFDGTHKTLAKNQHWHVPLNSEGRFDFKANQKKNGWKPAFHAAEWAKRETRSGSLMARLFIWDFAANRQTYFKFEQIGFIDTIRNQMRGMLFGYHARRATYYFLPIALFAGWTMHRKVAGTWKDANFIGMMALDPENANYRHFYKHGNMQGMLGIMSSHFTPSE